MQPAVQTVAVPFYMALIGLGVLCVLFALSLRTIRRGLQRPESPDSLRSEVDFSRIDSDRNGPPQQLSWDPRVRICSVLVFIFCTAYLHNTLFACAALAAAVPAVPASGASFKRSMARLAAMGGFLGMFLIVLPVTMPAGNGDTLFVLSNAPYISFNVRGVHVALLICIKAAAIAFLVEVLLGRMPFSTFIQALESLGLPPTVCRMIALVHRYMFVFGDESKRMMRGMRVRGFRGGSFSNTARAAGNLMGMLFVRSLERTERVHEAMISRGYTGKTAATVEFRAGISDWLKGVAFAAAGIGLIVLDRWMR